MKKYTIRLDDQYVCGISDNTTDEIKGGFNNGFHQGENCRIDRILFDKDKNHAKYCEGLRILKSWIDMIMTRKEAGFIDFKQMIIEEI